MINIAGILVLLTLLMMMVFLVVLWTAVRMRELHLTFANRLDDWRLEVANQASEAKRVDELILATNKQNRQVAQQLLALAARLDALTPTLGEEHVEH